MNEIQASIVVLQKKPSRRVDSELLELYFEPFQYKCEQVAEDVADFTRIRKHEATPLIYMIWEGEDGILQLQTVCPYLV
jgi:hypothetical protein